jgi:endonuclease YncB( thermonuclease family)
MCVHVYAACLQVKDVDQYGRNVAACSLKQTGPAAASPYDVNAHMVSTGHATAYR